MAFLLTEPSYHRVVRVIVRPRWSERVPSIEDVLSVYLVNDLGEELCIAIIHGLCSADDPSSRIAIETTNLTTDELAALAHQDEVADPTPNLARDILQEVRQGEHTSFGPLDSKLVR